MIDTPLLFRSDEVVVGMYRTVPRHPHSELKFDLAWIAFAPLLIPDGAIKESTLGL